MLANAPTIISVFLNSGKDGYSLAAFRSRLPKPSPDAENGPPDSRVWLTLIVEIIVLFVAAALAYVLVVILNIDLPPAIERAAVVGFSFIPLVLWTAGSALAEWRTPQRRTRLVVVLVVSMLAAQVAVQFVEQFLRPTAWLPLEDIINRIIGYTLSVGMVQEVTKYIVLRYTIWDDHLHMRSDAVAYSVTAALGYATVFNIQFVLANPGLSLDAAAFRVAEHVAINLMGSLLVSIGLAETRFANPTPFFMMIMVALSAFAVGASYPGLAGLVNATFSLRAGGVFDRPLVGFGLAAAIAAAAIVITRFLYSAIERRERELNKAKEG